MPALKTCICGTAFVTCMESELPRAADSGVPQMGSSRRVMWPREKRGGLP